ncbi:MAG: hypothetical protein WB992_14180 [Bryobacteraceae bacterium]
MKGTPARGRFPIVRALIAMIVVPVATVVGPALPGAFRPHSYPPDQFSLYVLFLESMGALSLAIPGYLVFLVLGIPTMYLLYRSNRLGFAWFMLFGALYTALPFPMLGLYAYSNRSEYVNVVRAFISLYAPIGILGGILTRLIVFGWRARGRRPARSPEIDTRVPE